MASYAHTFVSGETVTPAKLNNARTVSDIVNADIKSDAAIAGTKIAPNFGSQVVTMGNTVNVGGADSTNTIVNIGASATGNKFAVADFIGDVTYTDFGLRVGRRDDGANGTSTIEHRGTGALSINAVDAGRVVVSTSNVERMRINNQGDVLMGKTSLDWSLNGVQYEANNRYFVSTNTSEIALSLRRNTSNGAIATFNRDGTQVGTISVTTTATAYNTSSDYRLKENPQPMVGALSRLADVKPVTFTWKSNGSQGEGFIAHELQEVIPDAVTGAKDAVDADGNPAYQGVDASKLVPMLVAAVQELSAKVAALEAAQ